MSATELVNNLLEDGSDIKRELADAMSPEGYLQTLMHAAEEAGISYYNDPALIFLKDMINRQMPVEEAAELWQEWDEKVEEQGDWILGKAYELDFDITDFDRYWSDHYAGSFDSYADFAHHWVDNTMEKEKQEVLDEIRRFIDWDAYGRSLAEGMTIYRDVEGESEDEESGRIHLFHE